MNSDTCHKCHESVVSTDGIHWTHGHGDNYCGTGDGATAYPTYTNQDGDK